MKLTLRVQKQFPDGHLGVMILTGDVFIYQFPDADLWDALLAVEIAANTDMRQRVHIYARGSGDTQAEQE